MNNYYTEMCSGSEAGSYLRLIDFVYHSTLGLRVIKKKREAPCRLSPPSFSFWRPKCGAVALRRSEGNGELDLFTCFQIDNFTKSSIVNSVESVSVEC